MGQVLAGVTLVALVVLVAFLKLQEGGKQEFLVGCAKLGAAPGWVTPGTQVLLMVLQEDTEAPHRMAALY